MLPQPLSGTDRAAYDALSTGVAVMRRPDLHHLEFTGGKAAEVITGLVTSHVLALAVGEGQYAAALTAKGKIVADLRIVRLGEERFLTTSAAACWPGWRDLVRKYVNPRLARYAEPALQSVSLFGPQAGDLAQRLLTAVGARRADGHEGGERIPEVPYSGTEYVVDGDHAWIIGTPELGDVPGVEILGSPPLMERVEAWLASEPGVTPGTEAALDVARIEAGRPRWGRDMDDTTIPQEANLGALGALSFEKGCYTGQETVARVHFRGHVNRHLRVVRADVALPEGGELRQADGKVVGDVRSSALSPRLGAIAITMVRREVEPGTALALALEGADPVVVRVER